MDAAKLSFSKSNKNEVPVEHMDYSYIKQCTDTKELERIIEKLESGDEGYYPDLVNYSKKRLVELNPKSKVLIKDGIPASKYDTDKDEWEDIQKGMNEFEKFGQRNSTITDHDNTELPPVRNTTIISSDGKKKSKNEEWGKPSKDHIKSSDYRAWDKFDAEAAAKTIEDESSAGPSRSVAKDVNIQNTVDTTGMSEEEKVLKANREKDKGNEAFHAKDFEEALLYYSRSVSIVPSIPAYNNRALASIKLKKFNEAIEDCNKVLESEPDNVKALLRRATAKKGLNSYHAAKLDIQQTLALEPANKQAKTMLAEIVTVESKTEKKESKGKRILIDEVEGGSSTDEDNNEKKNEHGELDQADGNVFSSKKHIRNGDKNQELASPVSNNSDTVGEESPQVVETATTVESPEVKSTTNSSPTIIPSAPPPLPCSTVSFKDEALKLYSAGQYGQAAESYTSAIQSLLPEKEIHAVSLATLYSNRAACSNQTGDMRACIQDCDNALNLAPFLIKPYLRRAKAYETLERYREAYVDYRNVFHIDPVNKAAQDGSARCMMVLKEKDGRAWREKLPKTTQPPTIIPPVLTTVARNTSPAVTTSRPETTSTVKMSTGLSSSTCKKKDEENVNNKQNECEQTVELDAECENNANKTAEEILKRLGRNEGTDKNSKEDALSIEKQYQAAKDKGNMHHKKGEYNQAINCYSECIKLDKNQTVGYTNRALCHIKLNQPLLAEQDCSTVLQLDDQNVKAFYRRALSRKMLKEYRIALVDLNTLLKIEPTNKLAIKELEIVKDLYRNELRVKQSEQAAKLQKEKNEEITKKKKNNRKKIEIKEVDGSDEDEECKKEIEKKSEPKLVSSAQPQVEEKDNITKCEEPTQSEKIQASSTNVKPNGSTKSEGKKKKKKKSSKVASNQVPVDTTPVELKAGTPFEFTQSWTSIHSRHDRLQCLADLLMLIQPSKLPQIVSHSLDGELLTALVQCLNTVIIQKDVDMALKVLQYLPKVQRFTTVMMFLSSADKLALQQVFHSLSNAESAKFCKRDVEQLKRKHYAAL